ncbi:MAG: ATP-binding cassette domain-containing protein, partial [Carnobacterium sp.]
MEKTETTQPLIELTNVTKTFKRGKQETTILKGLDLKIYEGEFIMIMGKSGSGKTTMMNIIGFLD